MSDLRLALPEALGPIYRVTREVRPVGNCRLFIALEEPTGSDLLAKVLPGELSLGVDPVLLEREQVLLADRLKHPRLVAVRGSGRAGSHGLISTRRRPAGPTSPTSGPTCRRKGRPGWRLCSVRNWSLTHGDLRDPSAVKPATLGARPSF
jgi:hypothetical protein